MRYLMLFTIGFCASMAICAYFLCNCPVFCLVLAGICVLLVVVAYSIRTYSAHVAALCLAGMMFGGIWYWGYDFFLLSGARAVDGQTKNVQLLVTDYSSDTDYGVQANGRVSLAGKTYRVHFYLNERIPLSPGDRVEGSFRLDFTVGTGEQGAFYQGEGIFLLAYSRNDVQVTPGNDKSLRFLPARLRHGSLSVLEKVFPADTGGFAAALLLGEDSGLTYMDNTALKLSGIRHVVAVSGQHLAILMAAVLFLTGRRRRIACYLSIPVSILFSAMAGFSPSILRACVMQLILTGSFLFRREYDSPTSLAAAVLVMVAVNPMAITSVSLQLSAASVAGMILFSKRLYERMRGWYFFRGIKHRSVLGKLLFWVLGTLCVTISSMAVTIPLSAIYFKTVSLVSVITNLVTLWLVSFVFYGVIAAVILGAVWVPLGAVVGNVLSLLIRFILWVAQGLADFSIGCLYLRNPYIIIAGLLAYSILLVCISSKRVRLSLGAVLITVVLSIGLLFSWLQPRQDAYQILVLDVGQGQCIILHSGDRTYMVDCGGSYAQGAADNAVETLLSMGIDRLDGLIITHFDKDHVGGVPYLLQRIQVDTLILPEEPDSSYTRSFSEQCAGKSVVLTQDMAAVWEDSRLQIYAGNGGEYGNEMSLCVLFQSGNCDILITGDRPEKTELALLRHAQLPQLDYLVAGHHGSDDSTGEALLLATQPKTVLISVEAGNRYGHPEPELLERLEKFGCKVRRTDLEGTIIIRG